MRMAPWSTLVAGMAMAILGAQPLSAAPPRSGRVVPAGAQMAGVRPASAADYEEADDSSEYADESNSSDVQAAFSSEPAEAWATPMSGVSAMAEQSAEAGFAQQPYSGYAAPADGGGFVGPEGIGMPGYVPPGYNPWPTMSPFENSFAQHVNRDGLWMFRRNGNQVQFYSDVEYWFARLRQPGNQLVGSVRQDYSQLFLTNTDPANPTTQLLRFNDPDQGWPNATTNGFQNDFNFRERQGGRLRFGWKFADDSFVELTGYTVFRKTSHSGPGQVFNGMNLETLSSVTNSIPLDDGRTSFGGAGRVLRFDERFSLFYTQQLYGADLDLFTTPFYERNNVKVRALYGVKYNALQERFSIDARNSNYIYSVTTGTTTGGGGAGAGNQAGEGIPIDGTEINLAPFGVQPIDTRLTNNIVSHFIGPEIGLRYDLGGENFKIWGITKLAITANIHRINLSGQGFVENVNLQGDPNPFLSTADRDAGLGRPFTQTSNITSISPIVEQGIFGEFPLSYVPLIKKVPFLRNARVRGGYTIMAIAGVARPAQSTYYQYSVPRILPSRSVFTAEAVSLGLNWRY